MLYGCTGRAHRFHVGISNGELPARIVAAAYGGEPEDVTHELCSLLSSFDADQVYDPRFWKKLCFFALVEPDGDILPVRTRYNGESTNIGINPFKSANALWYSGPDIVASTLLTGRPPKILEAIRIVPEGATERT